jgi:hypothetical protein
VFSRWKALVDLCRPPGLDGAQVARNTFITLVEEVDFEAVAVDAAQNGRGGSFVVLIFVLATFCRHLASAGCVRLSDAESSMTVIQKDGIILARLLSFSSNRRSWKILGRTWSGGSMRLHMALAFLRHRSL